MCDRNVPPATIPRATAAAPDWSTLDVELRCPRCGYDLRRLPQARCPECGFAFDWEELLAAARNRLTSPLFEYRWRDRPGRSFLLTCWWAMWPWRLWRNLPLASKPRIAPLVALLTIVLAVQIPLCAGVDFAAFDYFTKHQKPGTAITLIAGFDWEFYAWAAGSDLVVAALTLLALQVFRRTLQLCRVRQGQLVRLVLLAAVGRAMWGIASVLVYEAVGHLQVRFDEVPRLPWRPWGHCVWQIKLAAPTLVFLVSIVIGLRDRLRVRRAGVIGAVAGTIVMLAMLGLVAGGRTLSETEVPYPYQLVFAWRWLDPVLDWLLCRP